MTAVNNTFLSCPKCSFLHDARVLVCQNLRCKFSHPVEAPIVGAAPAINLHVDETQLHD